MNAHIPFTENSDRNMKEEEEKTSPNIVQNLILVSQFLPLFGISLRLLSNSF